MSFFFFCLSFCRNCPFNNRLQDLNPRKSVPLLVEVVKVLTFREFFFEIVMVAEEFVIGGEGEVEESVVARDLVEDLALEVGELGEVGGGELVFLLGDVVLLLAEVVGEGFRRSYGWVDDHGGKIVLLGAVDGEEAAEGGAHDGVHTLRAHKRVELLLHAGGVLVVKRGRQHLPVGEHLLQLLGLVPTAGRVEPVDIEDFLGHNLWCLRVRK